MNSNCSIGFSLLYVFSTIYTFRFLEKRLFQKEFLSGIPGTIGGAIKMNAGAYGGEMKDIVVKTKYITLDGKIKTIKYGSRKNISNTTYLGDKIEKYRI